MKIFQAPVVKSIRDFYGDLLIPKASDTIFTHLSKLSDKLQEGLQKKEECLYSQLNNYNPNYLGIPSDRLKETHFDIEDCRHTIAKEYGFNSWKEIQESKNMVYNLDFEKCVDAVVNGEVATLLTLIEKNPKLTIQHSQYGHIATLLHYTGCNGVELWHQQVPLNLENIIELLIDKGADKNAKMKVYGGKFTPYDLYLSSAHPIDAGLNKSTANLLIP